MRQIPHSRRSSSPIRFGFIRFLRGIRLSTPDEFCHNSTTRETKSKYARLTQSRQAAETQAAVEKFEKLALKVFGPTDEIELSAFVEVAVGRERMFFFVAPCKGGLEIQHHNQEVLVITPLAPLGQQLVGKKTGDAFKWGAGKTAVEYRIVAVH